MTLSAAYGGDLLSSGEVPMEATWNFGGQQLNNVSILGVGTDTLSGNYAVEIDATDAGKGIIITNLPSGANSYIFTGGAMTAGSGFKMLNADDGRMFLSSSLVNTVAISSGVTRSWHDTGKPFCFGSSTDVEGLVQIEQADAAAEPVLWLRQLDVSEEFFGFSGESAADNTMSLLDAADLTTPGSVVGYIRVTVTDVASTGGIVDGTYCIPIQDLPTA